jgi:hypothetical protein
MESHTDNVLAESKIRTSASTYFFAINQEGIVFSESNQEIYALNTAAAYVWCLLEQQNPIIDIALDLAKLCEIPLPQAKTMLRLLLQQWRSSGLLENSEISASKYSTKKKILNHNITKLPIYENSIFISRRCYRLLDTYIQIRFTSLSQDNWIHPVLAHLEIKGEFADTTIDILQEANKYRLCRQDTSYQWTCDKLDKLAPLVKGLVLQAAINNHDYLLNIHAGVIYDGHQCILLPAAAGSGKTSLTAALIHSGFYYFSDEIALLDETTFNVRAVPISLCVKSTGLSVLQPYFQDIVNLRVNVREDGKLVRYIPPSSDNVWSDLGLSTAVAAIVFPKYSPLAPTAIQPVGKIEALNRLFRECMVLPKRLDYKKVAELVQWIQTVDCYELSFCTLDQAVALINQIRKS